MPNCDEWKAKEEPKGSSKIGNQGEEGVEKDFLLNLSGF